MADDNKEGIGFNEALRRIANNPPKKIVPAPEKSLIQRRKKARLDIQPYMVVF